MPTSALISPVCNRLRQRSRRRWSCASSPARPSRGRRSRATALEVGEDRMRSAKSSRSAVRPVIQRVAPRQRPSRRRVVAKQKRARSHSRPQVAARRRPGRDRRRTKSGPSSIRTASTVTSAEAEEERPPIQGARTRRRRNVSRGGGLGRFVDLRFVVGRRQCGDRSSSSGVDVSEPPRAHRRSPRCHRRRRRWAPFLARPARRSTNARPASVASLRIHSSGVTGDGDAAVDLGDVRRRRRAASALSSRAAEQRRASDPTVAISSSCVPWPRRPARRP